MATKLTEVYEKYQKYVVKNQDAIGYLETSIRCLSYIIAVRIEDSAVLSELLYTASKLLVMTNDYILRKSAHIKSQVPVSQEKLRQWLTVIEHVGVLLEFSSLRYLGRKGRWVVIACIEITKAIMRLILLLKHGSGIQPARLIGLLNREHDLSTNNNAAQENNLQDLLVGNNVASRKRPAVTFSLKHSGREVRTLVAAPPLNKRTWNLPSSQQSAENSSLPTTLNSRQQLSEILHICRPLAHLVSMYIFGSHSWKPWLISSGVDVASLKMFGEKEKYNRAEKEELKRRQLLLILYMLRSPFYDSYGKAQLTMILRLIAYIIPGAGLLTGPLLDYLPEWQKTYFYVWAN